MGDSSLIFSVLGSILSLFLIIIGFLLRRSISEIDDKIRSNGKSLHYVNEKLRAVELMQRTQGLQIEQTRDQSLAAASLTREMKAHVEDSLREMRQEIKRVTDEQYEQKQTFGKIIIIMQKLHAAVRGNGAPPKV